MLHARTAETAEDNGNAAGENKPRVSSERFVFTLLLLILRNTDLKTGNQTCVRSLGFYKCAKNNLKTFIYLQDKNLRSH